MGVKMRRNHKVDALFPVLLFFVFTISALTVLLLAANIYQTTVENTGLNDTARTALAYIVEKVHQNDDANAVEIGEFDGCQALILKQMYHKEMYATYIYEDGGELKEIFLKEGAKAGASGGTTIFPVKDFSMELIADHLIRFECTDESGKQETMVVGVNSERSRRS